MTSASETISSICLSTAEQLDILRMILHTHIPQDEESTIDGKQSAQSDSQPSQDITYRSNTSLDDDTTGSQQRQISEEWMDDSSDDTRRQGGDTALLKSAIRNKRARREKHYEVDGTALRSSDKPDALTSVR
ncbi:uncharacterized protein IL334_000532 [Kwoniella shivajii]|uniref:Uncharacterized protein n=1 Tax=Kwoniella shivajii TaxID=564305 RepID=A0ABZ1CPE2_9TREE|nr:hypothetical protein IL334_000532 [Kwoniella shivajii]